MKHSFLVVIAVMAVALVLSGTPANAQSGYDLFQKALATERADGNLREAIQLYERVVAQFPKDRPLVARALIRIADCREKLGQRDAAQVYERIVREFADQTESVAVARARLAALQSPVPPAVQAVRKIWSGPDTDAMGSLSADGRWLSHTNWVTGDLALRDVAAGTSRMLTNKGGWEASGDYAEFSVVSPDGRQVAYAWFVDKGSDPKATCACTYELRVMATSGPDAGKARTLLRMDAAAPWMQPSAWTRDGKGLIIVRTAARDTFEIGLLSLADNTIRVLKTVAVRPPSKVTLSPDGQFIAFDTEASAGSGARDIVLLSLTDLRETIAVQHPAHDYSAMFTRDGSQLLFMSDRTGVASLWRLPLAGGRPGGPPVLVAPAATNATILGTTSSGAAYYWTGGANSNVYMADLDEQMVARQAPRRVIERFINANGAPAFSPDGQSLAYQSQRSATQTGRTGGTIVIHALATGEDRDVPFRLAAGDGMSWFPDNRSLLVSVRAQREDRIGYYRVDVTSGEHRLLMSTDTLGAAQRRARVSPDGKTIYFADRRLMAGSGRWILARYDIATAQTTELRTLDEGSPITSYQVSPDGTELAYLRSDTDGRQSILEVMPSAGGVARELFRERTLGRARFSGLAWSPDKRYVFVVRDNDLAAPGGMPGGSVWKIPTAGGPAETTGIDMPGMVRFLTLDPGSRRLAFAAEGGADPAIWAVENFLPRK